MLTQTTFLETVIDYRNWHLELDQRFRSLKVWFVLRSYGVEGFRAPIRNVGLFSPFAFTSPLYPEADSCPVVHRVERGFRIPRRGVGYLRTRDTALLRPERAPVRIPRLQRERS